MALKPKNPLKRLRVFISHSSHDERFAEALAHLVEKALGLGAADIRCSSVNGYRLSAGTDVDAILRDEVASAQSFIVVLTPASLSSHYVLFELGARWGARLPLAPLLASSITPSDLQGPLGRLVALSASDSGQLHQLLNDIGATAGITLKPPHTYDQELQSVIHLAAPPGPPMKSLSSKPGPLAESTLSAIQALCAALAEDFDDIFVDPKIPQRILRNARGRFLEAEDKVIAFIANSYGGQDGMAILRSGLCWRNSYREPSHRLAWAELNGQAIKSDKSADAVHIGRKLVIDLSGSYAKSAAIAKFLRDILALIS